MDLPEFLKFLKPGWWFIHILSTVIIYLLGMGHGRRLAMKEQQNREAGKSAER